MVICVCLRNITRMCCVVKANGYGAVQLFKPYEKFEVDYLAV